MELSVLILDRKSNELWIEKGGDHESVIRYVTSVEWTTDIPKEVMILYKGEYRGLVWNVKEIKERW